MKFFQFLICLLLACCSGCVADSENPAAGPGAEKPTYRIAVIPKGTTHQFWKSVHFGAEKAAAELGNVKIVWQGPVNESDTPSQIEVVKNMITRGVDGIVLAPNHSESLVDAVQESIDEGIPVAIFDSGLAPGPEIVAYVATDNRHGGQLAAQTMAQAIGEKGNVILLRYRTGSESTTQREEGFLEEIARYPDIKVVSSDQYGEDTTAKAKNKVGQLLQLHGDDLAGIFAVCESNANGTLLALEDSGLQGKVKFIAFDPSPQLITAMQDGNCHGIVLQDPVRMGYDSVHALVKHLQGEAVEAQVSTGEYVATPKNAGDEPYQTLLNPQQFDK